MSPFDISIVLAEAPGRPDLDAALESIERACAGLAAEVLVVRPKGREAVPASSVVTIRELIVEESSLVPVRWGVGVRAAQAPAFGCLTTEFTVHPEWARASLAALTGNVVGVAGAIDLAPGAPPTATAVYLVRFSSYMPGAIQAPQAATQIPGDTAVYRRDAVTAFQDLLAEGFWEIEFHRRFLAQGSELVALPQSLATFHSTRSLRASLALRYRHGVDFGVTRVVRHRHNRALLVIGSPLVPTILLARIARRVARVPGGLSKLIRGLAGVALISGAWAVGEARGAWSARSDS